ncbi:hypothetical protein Ahy_A06g029345 [Arachis hypogaea]|uniref:Uncharacterized protein n=1 Tax=Arachis hypogaea TaxID=3818 RepID=A0A445CT23_ARAHY|nr:hypothetical protein Ahy_A06g029345 [Arachis hypogaea]
MMSDIRQGRNNLTIWIHPSIKKDLEAHFKTDEGFKHCHLMNATNRALPRSSKYTDGSATFMKTKCELSKSLDREATLAETFKYTHTFKERFTYEQSVANYEDYTQRLEAASQQSQPPSGNDDPSSNTSVVDLDSVWRKTAFEPHKNCHFGLGSFFTSGLCTSALAASSASASATSPANPEEVVNLREEVQKLT